MTPPVGHYFSYFERALKALADGVADGRLKGTAAATLADIDNAALTRPVPVRYQLFGPGDVERLAAGAITRRFPAPYAGNAEVTKLALVEFSDYDLPWRYTPQIAGPQGLRPWLVLVVGQRAPDDIVLRPDGRVTLGVVAQTNHPLSSSSHWAHVHQVSGHDPIGRVVAPMVTRPDPAQPGEDEYGYLPDTQYVACLVPAFDATGGDSWSGVAPVTCALYDWWTFRTGPEGDFRDLARKLHRAKLELPPGAKPFGTAVVGYRSRTTPPVTTPLETRGALQLPFDPETGALDVAIGDETAALARRIVTPDGRRVITVPRYDAPFADAAAGATPVPDSWIAQLRGDPRRRGAAGLGAWTAIAWQDRIGEAAAAKAGDLGIAADRVRHVALGVEASRSLWRRRLPESPVDRLVVLLPALGRMVTVNGASVLDEVAGRTPQLSRALLSSAARRALRPGPARTARSANGRAPFGETLVAANQCPDDRDPSEIPPSSERASALIKHAVYDAAGGDEAVAGTILQHLGSGPTAGAVAAALRALAPGPGGKPDRDAIRRFLDTGEFPEPDWSPDEWSDWMERRASREPCRPIDLDRLSGLVSSTIDPTVERPPAVERVLSTLPGITGIGPVEIEPELDLPLWSFLSDRAPDWMLPGVGDLQDGDVVALSTNPVFVEALLVGANHQATAELRWRNIPLRTRSSPLRKFWQRKDGGFDILPIKNWSPADPLGGASLAPSGLTAEAVVAFRTSLFRRYPATVVYLYRRDGDWTPPDPSEGIDPVRRSDPTFTGAIGKDVTFFGFSVRPEDLADSWVVLEEPPAGYRFYHQPLLPTPADDPHSAEYAHRRFAVPVRVLIGALLSDPA